MLTKNFYLIKIYHIKSLLILITLLLLTACTVSTPIAYDNKIKSNTKVGKACGIGLLYFPPLVGQDQTVKAAKANGEIKDIYSIEKITDYYILFNKSCNIVKGQ
ncbi:TRL-like protein [Candidatus Hepatincola sp. Av]